MEDNGQVSPSEEITVDHRPEFSERIKKRKVWGQTVSGLEHEPKS